MSMPEFLGAGLAPSDFLWLVGACFLSGSIYGFAGFGAALIYMPLATMVVSPIFAIASFSIAAIGSLFTVLPKAWKKSDKTAATTMLVAALIAIGPGVYIARVSDPVLLRWAVSLTVLVTLACLMAGWRYSGRPSLPAWLGVGSLVGFFGGSVGINGPPLILFQLGGSDSVERSRANSIAVLSLSSVAFVPMAILQGALPAGAVVSGLFLVVPYGLGALFGGWLFDPDRSLLYRRVAYGVIAATAIIALPVFG